MGFIFQYLSKIEFIYLKIFSGEPGEQMGTLAEKNGGKTFMQEYREIHGRKVQELAA
jgi:hypothetical protein